MLHIRLSDLRKTKNQDGALEKKNVDYQFEFPRQCIVQKNALSLTQVPMFVPSLVEICTVVLEKKMKSEKFIEGQMDRRTDRQQVIIKVHLSFQLR